ncbi:MULTISPECIES: N-acetyltransferase [unclassified Streptomyces]|uniref:GNAT family N-acetyltransferase n=1 Tax=unclassified Streptomyces TaxID=2593676 RepID=UPI002251CF5C|nr:MULTISPECIES: GNAT family N-acetyltransferase [unclassified Streptomyces]MCX4527874.1 GNAT family N-acetyltransferase [Streptomyces sp. NBC_01551]MCX4541528.1 GNAT family N-acetyltransferase [Streptomyces sp. NBC_01565]
MTDMLTVRPAGPGDAADICALLNAVDIVEIGRPETDLGTVEADLHHPDVNLATDSWLAFQRGRLVAYALVWADSGPGRVDCDHYVLPGHPEAAAALLDRMAVRARAMGGAAERSVLRLQLNVKPTLDLALLTRRGYRTVRRYQVMTRALDPAADLAPAPPQGLTLRHCAADEADRRRAHALVEETFAAHFGHVERAYEPWLDHLDARDLDWSLVWIAQLPGHGDAAVLLTRDDRTSMGWISHIGVREDLRGRGIGGFLLRHGFAAYAARGRDTVGLGVDVHNETGALGLYEAHGMGLHYAVDTWELALHPQG